MSAHWLGTVATRAGLKGAERLSFAAGMTNSNAWRHALNVLDVDAQVLASLVARHFRLPTVRWDEVSPQSQRLVPEKLVRQYQIMPLRDNDRHIVVATSDPTNYELEQAVSFAAGRQVLLEIAPPTDIERSISENYASTDAAVETLLRGIDSSVGEITVLQDTGPEAVAARELEATPVVKLTNLIIQEAIAQRASDVHIEPAPAGGVVRFRVDGVLRQFMALPAAAMTRVISRIKIISRIDIADRLRPHDGRARVLVNGRPFDLRTSTIPVRDTEKAVLRILDPNRSIRLADLELPDIEAARFRQLLSYRDGIVLVTGPTGSGKTTTLYGALREVNTGNVNISTVEDPIEYELPGIAQIQVETKRGVTFGSALRALLRQDPDIILVGEVRDHDTARMALQASMTGHLVFSTLHTNDAVGVVPRLVELGLDRAAIASSLRGAVGQRLIRRVCTCAVPVQGDLTSNEKRLAETYGQKPAVRAAGCARCGETGYRGRIPVLEVLVNTPHLQELITRDASVQELQKAAIVGGMRPMLRVALDRAASGETTLEEIERVLGENTGTDAHEETPAAVATSAAEEQLHVLVVDDDEETRIVARAVLQQHAYVVDEATNGEIAIRQLEGGRCSLILLDLDMPVMDGRATLRRLKSSPATAGIPVIVLTGSDDPSDEIDAMEAGAEDYLRKPIDPARFIARVRATLRRAGTA